MKQQAFYQSSTARRVRTLAASLTVLLVGAAFYAQNVRAEVRDVTPSSFAGACSVGSPA